MDINIVFRIKKDLQKQQDIINSSLYMQTRSLIEKYYTYLITHSVEEGGGEEKVG